MQRDDLIYDMYRKRIESGLTYGRGMSGGVPSGGSYCTGDGIYGGGKGSKKNSEYWNYFKYQKSKGYDKDYIQKQWNMLKDNKVEPIFNPGATYITAPTYIPEPELIHTLEPELVHTLEPELEHIPELAIESNTPKENAYKAYESKIKALYPNMKIKAIKCIWNNGVMGGKSKAYCSQLYNMIMNKKQYKQRPKKATTHVKGKMPAKLSEYNSFVKTMRQIYPDKKAVTLADIRCEWFKRKGKPIKNAKTKLYCDSFKGLN